MITHRTKNKISFITMEGEITEKTVRELHLYTIALLANEKTNALIINLQKIYYFDQTGVKEVLMLSRAIQKKAVRFALCELKENLAQKLRNNSFHINVPIYATEKQALVSNLNRRLKERTPPSAKTLKSSHPSDAWVNIRIPGDILSKIDIWANQQNQERTEIIIEGIRQYVQKRQCQALGKNAPMGKRT